MRGYAPFKNASPETLVPALHAHGGNPEGANTEPRSSPFRGRPAGRGWTAKRLHAPIGARETQGGAGSKVALASRFVAATRAGGRERDPTQRTSVGRREIKAGVSAMRTKSETAEGTETPVPSERK